MRADVHWPQDFRSGADIDMSGDIRDALVFIPGPNRDLLKDQTIDADLCVRMNNDPVGMRDEQTSTNLAASVGYRRP